MNLEQKNQLFKNKVKKNYLAQLPGIKDPEELERTIGEATKELNFHLLDPTTVELAQQRGKLPPGTFDT